MKQCIKSLIKIARVLSVDDSGKFRFCKIFYQGQSSKAQMFSPYGLYHNPPKGSMALVLSQNAQDSNSIAIASDPDGRRKNAAEGVVGINNQLSNGYVECGEQDVIISSDNDIIINAENDVIINAENNITVNATNLSLNISDNTTITIGSMSIIINNNGINVTNGDIVVDSISLKTHVHGGVQSGGSNTGTPI